MKHDIKYHDSPSCTQGGPSERQTDKRNFTLTIFKKKEKLRLTKVENLQKNNTCTILKLVITKEVMCIRVNFLKSLSVAKGN